MVILIRKEETDGHHKVFVLIDVSFRGLRTQFCYTMYGLTLWSLFRDHYKVVVVN